MEPIQQARLSQLIDAFQHAGIAIAHDRGRFFILETVTGNRVYLESPGIIEQWIATGSPAPAIIVAEFVRRPE